MHRFFLLPENIRDGKVFFPEDSSHQIHRVLRLRHDQIVNILDNQGSIYEVKLSRISAQGVEGEVLSQWHAEGEPHTQLSLYVCLTQREKFEWILQKCTEIGVIAFIPVISSRSLVQEKVFSQKRIVRWKRILKEAAEQCRRGRIPDLLPVLPFEQAIKKPKKQDTVRIILWEDETRLTMRQFLAGLSRDSEHQPQNIEVLVGSEGGFTEEEVAAARLAGFISVSLGERILRMETASIAAAALILFDQGDMGV